MTNGDQALADRLIALTRDLVLIPSTFSRPDSRERCLRFLRNHLDSLDQVVIREASSNGFGSLVAHPAGIERPDILLCGHIDVVDHPDPDCFRSEVRDGRIHGPGAGDMKGEVAILLDLFVSVHRRWPGASLGLAVTSDEEIGGEDGVRHLVEDLGLRCGVVVIPDGGSILDVTVEEKGIVHARLVAEGVASHAARPWLADNAVHRVARTVADLEAAWPWPEDAARRVDHWFPTCTVTRIGTSNETTNCVPDDAWACIDLRFPPPETIESMLERVRAIASRHRVGVELIVGAETTHLAPDGLWVEIAERLTGRPVRFVRASGGSDAKFFRDHGIPVVLSRPLVGNLHAVDEWIDIESMLTFHRIAETFVVEKLDLAAPAGASALDRPGAA